MIDYILLACGVSILASVFLYTAWPRLRLILVRQTLFEIRGRLWDTARERDAFSDPAYVAARSHLNMLIGAVGWMSLPVFSVIRREARRRASECIDGAGDDLLVADDPVIAKAIEQANEESAQLMMIYMLGCRASGLLHLVGIVLSSTTGIRSHEAVPQSVVRVTIDPEFEAAMTSDSLKSLSRLDEVGRRGPLGVVG